MNILAKFVNEQWWDLFLENKAEAYQEKRKKWLKNNS